MNKILDQYRYLVAFCVPVLALIFLLFYLDFPSTPPEPEAPTQDQTVPLSEMPNVVTLTQDGKASEKQEEQQQAVKAILKNPFDFPQPEQEKKKPLLTPVPQKQEPQQVAQKAKPERPRIVIVIDDMGMAHRRSKEVVALMPPLTLAYLPYAEGLKKQTKSARDAGHVLMVHMPMEPKKLKQNNPGPRALLLENTLEQNVENLRHNLKKFDHYVGFNNHMGSAFTANKQAFEPIAREAVARNLLFLDSRTSSDSVAYEMTRALGGKALVRDVFLDHYTDYDSVMKALVQTEEIARRKGTAIAIGHPKKETIAALKDWLPTLKDKGIDLVPITQALQ